MILMNDEEVFKLAYGSGAQTTATVLRIFGALAVIGGLLLGFAFAADMGATGFSGGGTAGGIGIASYGLLAGAILNAFAWVIDLLRGILAGVWHTAWQVHDDDDDDDDG